MSRKKQKSELSQIRAQINIYRTKNKKLQEEYISNSSIIQMYEDNERKLSSQIQDTQKEIENFGSQYELTQFQVKEELKAFERNIKLLAKNNQNRLQSLIEERARFSRLAFKKAEDIRKLEQKIQVKRQSYEKMITEIQTKTMNYEENLKKCENCQLYFLKNALQNSNKLSFNDHQDSSQDGDSDDLDEDQPIPPLFYSNFFNDFSSHERSKEEIALTKQLNALRQFKTLLQSQIDELKKKIAEKKK